MIYISLYSLYMQNVMLFEPHDLSCGSEHHEISSENGSSDEEMQFTPPACTTPQLTQATPEDFEDWHARVCLLSVSEYILEQMIFKLLSLSLPLYCLNSCLPSRISPA